MGAFDCFDYWLNRYQTLFVGLVTLVPLAVGIRIAFGQMTIMRKQLSSFVMERHLARFKMLDKISKLLDGVAWSETDIIPRPESNDLTRDVIVNLSAAFDRRKARVNDLKASLSEAVRDAADRDKAVVTNVLTELDAAMRGYQEEVDTIIGDRTEHAGQRSAVGLWFFAVEQPDNHIAGIMAKGRRAIDVLKMDVVVDMASEA